MVGVPRSKGCATCKLRGIKCDEMRPSCSQCRRGGRKCPGYKQVAKFVDEGVKFQSKPDRKPLQAPSFNLPNYCLDLRGLSRQAIVGSFIEELFPLGRLTVQHSFIGSWLWHIPQVLHITLALDIAAESVALAYFAKREHSKGIIERSRWAYSEALKLLFQSLHNSRLRLAPETLCATMLLLHYEQFVEMQSKSWISHANGVGCLIKLRGPDRHRSGLGHFMFMAARPYLIAEAIVTGQQCFLDDDAWRYIDIENINSPLIPENCSIFHDGLNHFAKVPGLLKDFKVLGACRSSANHGKVHCISRNLRSDLINWWDRLQSARQRPLRELLPVSKGTENKSAYEYADVMTAAFSVNYSAHLIQINNLLDSLEGNNLHRKESIELAEDICLSTTYCSSAGFCGAQAMVSALPIALTRAPERHTHWIKQQISYFEGVHGSHQLRSCIVDRA